MSMQTKQHALYCIKDVLCVQANETTCTILYQGCIVCPGKRNNMHHTVSRMYCVSRQTKQHAPYCIEDVLCVQTNETTCTILYQGYIVCPDKRNNMHHTVSRMYCVSRQTKQHAPYCIKDVLCVQTNETTCTILYQGCIVCPDKRNNMHHTVSRMYCVSRQTKQHAPYCIEDVLCVQTNETTCTILCQGCIVCPDKRNNMHHTVSRMYCVSRQTKQHAPYCIKDVLCVQTNETTCTILYQGCIVCPDKRNNMHHTVSRMYCVSKQTKQHAPYCIKDVLCVQTNETTCTILYQGCIVCPDKRNNMHHTVSRMYCVSKQTKQHAPYCIKDVLCVQANETTCTILYQGCIVCPDKRNNMHHTVSRMYCVSRQTKQHAPYCIKDVLCVQANETTCTILYQGCIVCPDKRNNMHHTVSRMYCVSRQTKQHAPYCIKDVLCVQTNETTCTILYQGCIVCPDKRNNMHHTVSRMYCVSRQTKQHAPYCIKDVLCVQTNETTCTILYQGCIVCPGKRNNMHHTVSRMYCVSRQTKQHAPYCIKDVLCVQANETTCTILYQGCIVCPDKRNNMHHTVSRMYCVSRQTKQHAPYCIEDVLCVQTNETTCTILYRGCIVCPGKRNNMHHTVSRMYCVSRQTKQHAPYCIKDVLCVQANETTCTILYRGCIVCPGKRNNMHHTVSRMYCVSRQTKQHAPYCIEDVLCVQTNATTCTILYQGCIVCPGKRNNMHHTVSRMYCVSRQTKQHAPYCIEDVLCVQTNETTCTILYRGCIVCPDKRNNMHHTVSRMYCVSRQTKQHAPYCIKDVLCVQTNETTCTILYQGCIVCPDKRNNMHHTVSRMYCVSRQTKQHAPYCIKDVLCVQANETTCTILYQGCIVCPDKRNNMHHTVSRMYCVSRQTKQHAPYCIKDVLCVQANETTCTILYQGCIVCPDKRNNMHHTVSRMYCVSRQTKQHAPYCIKDVLCVQTNETTCTILYQGCIVCPGKRNNMHHTVSRMYCVSKQTKQHAPYCIKDVLCVQANETTCTILYQGCIVCPDKRNNMHHTVSRMYCVSKQTKQHAPYCIKDVLCVQTNETTCTILYRGCIVCPDKRNNMHHTVSRMYCVSRQTKQHAPYCIKDVLCVQTNATTCTILYQGCIVCPDKRNNMHHTVSRMYCVSRQTKQHAPYCIEDVLCVQTNETTCTILYQGCIVCPGKRNNMHHTVSRMYCVSRQTKQHAPYCIKDVLCVQANETTCTILYRGCIVCPGKRNNMHHTVSRMYCVSRQTKQHAPYCVKDVLCVQTNETTCTILCQGCIVCPDKRNNMHHTVSRMYCVSRQTKQHAPYCIKDVLCVQANETTCTILYRGCIVCPGKRNNMHHTVSRMYCVSRQTKQHAPYCIEDVLCVQTNETTCTILYRGCIVCPDKRNNMHHTVSRMYCVSRQTKQHAPYCIEDVLCVQANETTCTILYRGYIVCPDKRNNMHHTVSRMYCVSRQTKQLVTILYRGCIVCPGKRNNLLPYCIEDVLCVQANETTCTILCQGCIVCPGKRNNLHHTVSRMYCVSRQTKQLVTIWIMYGEISCTMKAISWIGTGVRCLRPKIN